MSKRESIRKELTALCQEGANLWEAFQKRKSSSITNTQRWYTKAIKALHGSRRIALQRFHSYYEIDPQRKLLQSGTYVMQDS